MGDMFAKGYFNSQRVVLKSDAHGLAQDSRLSAEQFENVLTVSLRAPMVSWHARSSPNFSDL